MSFCYIPPFLMSQPVSNQMAVVVGTGSPDLEGYGRERFETVCCRGEGAVKCRSESDAVAERK
jgi:hypothetical protein